jgi:hypothetical protein
MRYSRTNIVNAHLEFLKQVGVEVTQEQRNKWSVTPLKYLKKFMAQERLALLKKDTV